LLNASVRSNFQNYQCQLLPAITNQWNHGSLQSMLKGPLLTASCQISAARNCSVVPISDSWGSYLLYMCRISKDPMHTPRQSVCCTIHLSQVYPSVTYWDAVNMMDVAWCSINTDTYWYYRSSRMSDSERTEILIWSDWRWLELSRCLWVPMEFSALEASLMSSHVAVPTISKDLKRSQRWEKE
jgi:hypothetical protein